MVAHTQSAGLARMTTALIALSWYFQWGTGSAAAQSANVVTTTTTTEARVGPVTATQVTGSFTNDTLQLAGTITSAGARSITEVGAFDAAGSGSPPTGGNMDIYSDFGVVTLATGDSIAFTMKVQYS